MTRFILSALVTVAILTTCYSCKVKAVTYKVSQIDSALKIVNPDYNCGCNKDKEVKIRSARKGKRNMYYSQALVVKDTNALHETAAKTREQLITLIPELSYYRWIYLELWKNNSTEGDTALTAVRLGTSYFIKNKCSGYRRDATAKELIKKIYNKKFEAELCR